jgi:pyruvate,water dikinase
VLPGASAREIAALADRLRVDHLLLAVRSSAQDEDDARTSFAGIHDSHLGVHPDDLPGAVEQVSASALSARARAYRNQVGLPPPSNPCAVVVQPLIASEQAGVAFGAGPGRNQVVIEAVAGLGQTAVDGTVTPETHVLHHAAGRWTTHRIMPGSQAFALVVRGHGVSRVARSEAEQDGDVIAAAGVTPIAEGVGRLERLAGCSLDVEWAHAGGTVWFLQARPRTRPLDERVPPHQIWSRVNARDVLPDLPSAFARSTVGAALDKAEHEFQRRHGIWTDPAVPLFRFIHGRPVFNERIFLVADLLGASRKAMQVEFGGTSEADDAVGTLNLPKALRHPMILVRALLVAAGAERGARRFLTRVGALRAQVGSIDVEAARVGELVDVVGATMECVARPWAFHAMTLVAALTNAQYPVMRRLRRAPTPRALLARLVADGDGSVSTRQLDDLVVLAQAFRAWPGAADFARAITPDHARVRHWQDRLPPDLWEQTRVWLDQYGHRGPFESDIAQPRYADDLRLFARALFPLVSDGGAAASARTPDRRRAAAIRAFEEVDRRCGRWGRRRTETDVRRVRRLMALRESLRSEVVALILPLRRMLLELGSRLVQQGRLGEPNDVWHLSLDELRRACDQSGFAADVAVARERARLAAWRRIEVPNRFGSEDVSSMAFPTQAIDESGSTLRGNGISPGLAEGEVRVLRSPIEDRRFMSGAILVAPATDPAWTPLFARAVGVIVELGGALSHAGIVAREYGIPCVANIDGITRALRDGDVVRMDGALGVVTVVSRAAARHPVSRVDRKGADP